GAERMTGQLASLLRSSLDSAASPLVPLEQELKIITDYLEIERVRFGDRLRYEVDVQPGMEQAHVPRLSLQTLVENSVKFAVSPRRSGATVRIRAAQMDGTMSLTVEDDGPGFGEDQEPAGHGLALLKDRLRITYGGAAR